MKNDMVTNKEESGRVTLGGNDTSPYVHNPVEVYLPEYAKTICPEPLPKFDVVPLLLENLVLQTAYLKTYRKPISLLFLGMAGLGKSRLFNPLIRFQDANYINDITPKYLVEFLEKVKNGNRKTLAIPDFIHCTSHSMATRTVLTSILRSMTEEGVKDLSDYHLEFKSEKPIKANLITALTKASYNDFAIEWKKSGFLSRLLPFSYSHSVATQEAIMSFIEKRQPDPIYKVKFKVKKDPKSVVISPSLLSQLHAYEELLGKSTSSTPYRGQIQLISITEALTVLRDRDGDETTQEDIEVIRHLCHWLNYEFRDI